MWRLVVKFQISLIFENADIIIIFFFSNMMKNSD